MSKKFLSLLLLTTIVAAAFSFFTATPASAAPHHGATAAVATDRIGDICSYQVTATAGLNARSGPGTNFPVRYTMPFNDITDAFSITASGSGFTWRELGDGNWAVTNWLRLIPGSCHT